MRILCAREKNNLLQGFADIHVKESLAWGKMVTKYNNGLLSDAHHVALFTALLLYYIPILYYYFYNLAQLGEILPRWETTLAGSLARAHIRNGSRRVNRCIITVARATQRTRGWKVRGKKVIYTYIYIILLCRFCRERERGENTRFSLCLLCWSKNVIYNILFYMKLATFDRS